MANKVYCCLLLILAIAFISLHSSNVAAAVSSKVINVQLRAKWTGTPLLLETGEFLAREDGALYWRFLDKWQAAARVPAGGSDKACVDQTVGLGSDLMGTTLAPLLELALSMRTLSPKVVLYRQLAQESLRQANLSHGTGSGRWEINRNPDFVNGHCCWVDVGGKVLLGESQLEKWLEDAGKGVYEGEGVAIHDFDHVHPDSPKEGFGVALHGSPGTSCFEALNPRLTKAAQQKVVRYAYRPVLANGCESEAARCALVGHGGLVSLGGYGVEMALKNMEYKAIDDSAVKNDGSAEEIPEEDLTQEVKGFVFSTLLERRPELHSELLTFRDHLLASNQDAVRDSYSVWELKDLGVQATHRITQASEPLRLLQEISHNFPNLVTSLSRVKVDEALAEELRALQKMVQAGRNIITLNGIILDLDHLDVFSLLEKVRSELKLAADLAKLEIPAASIRQLAKVPPVDEDNQIRLDFRSAKQIHFLNDLEKDAQYRSWRSNLNELLMPTYPGQMRAIRKNLFHAIYVIDPASHTGFKALEEVTYYYRNRVPVRLAIFLVSPRRIAQLAADSNDVAPADWEEGDLPELAARMFIHIRQNLGVKAAFEFLETAAYDPSSMGGMFGGYQMEAEEEEKKPITEKVFEDAFLEHLGGDPGDALEALAELKKGKSPEAAAVLAGSQELYQLGLGASYPCLLFNGIYFGPDQMLGTTMEAMSNELQEVQRGVYYQQISSRTNILDHFFKEGSVKRYNPQVLGTDGTPVKYVGLAEIVREKDEAYAALQYLHQPGTEDDVKAFSHWLVVDLCSAKGVDLLAQVARHLASEEGNSSRIAIVYSTNDEMPGGASPGALLLPRIIQALTAVPSRRSKLVPLLSRLLASLDIADVTNPQLDEARTLALANSAVQVASEVGLKTEGLRDLLTEPTNVEAALRQLAKSQEFASERLGLERGTNAIITNGRVLEIGAGGSFAADDFALLEKVEGKKAQPVAEILGSAEWEPPAGMDLDDFTSDFLSSAVMAAASEIWARDRKGDYANLDQVFEKVSKSVVSLENEDAVLSLEGILDPLSSGAQALAPLLVLLQDWLNPAMRLILNPQLSLAEVPLKNYYRFAQPPKGDFSADGALGPGPSVVLGGMPQARTLTMNLKLPDPWLVEPTVAVYDLDNLVLEKIPERTIEAIFELEALTITGHCYEESSPPRGLQLVLGTPQQPHAVDTIVMANLGYFQLKASPALWTLHLAPGRSRDLYTIGGEDGEAEEERTNVTLVVGDLAGKLVRLEVVRRPGRGGEELLQSDKDDEEEEGAGKQKRKSVWGSMFKAFGGLGDDDEEEGEEAKEETVPSPPKVASSELQEGRSGKTINIFSIASGHLYERFTKIMILSVLRNTRRPVKFWFIKNYLSPSFKDVIPVMAKHYGFEAELVTYKWPSWLHKQTEKQRLIWAYKILFLDVLFPLSLEKVIFVDADQVVRTDMGELYDMNLKGRPLAYTPMCDNNLEMEGYRFWKQGFWRDHLQGRPYHISALYVVDLVKFRQLAAGDQLRVFYENLSKDPNSLANLDQDLPNYAQHSVPIFSLPQHWLWCESWCGTATKEQAKTIDLCNNPMTKEPKLEGARRIVSEWPGLDEEQRRFTEKVESGEIDLEGVHASTWTSLDTQEAATTLDSQQDIEKQEGVEGELAKQQEEEALEDRGSDDKDEL